MTLPIRISVRVDFDDGSQHEYEVRGKDAVSAPGGFWPEGVVTSDVAQRIGYASKRAEEIERLRGGFGCSTCHFDQEYGFPDGINWCGTVRSLVSVYSDHPDYDPAWAASL